MQKQPIKLRSRSQGRQSRKTYWRPSTTKLPALLEGGSDDKFRKLIYGLWAISSAVEFARLQFGSRIGVTGPGYTMLMAIADSSLESGIRITELAKLLNLSKPFVTTECTKLVQIGLVRKRPDPNDARSAFLTATAKGKKEVRRLIPLAQRLNDVWFGSFSRAQFQDLCNMIDILVADSESALTVLKN